MLRLVHDVVTPPSDVDQVDALTLAHTVAELVTVLRNDSHRLHSNAQRLQAMFLLHAPPCVVFDES
jgi:hypothetical protein